MAERKLANIIIPYQENRKNVTTGENDFLYPKLQEAIHKAKTIDIIVSFLMESGVKMFLKDLKEAVARRVSIRILTGNYLNITQPQALYLLKKELGNNVDLRFYNIHNKSFHPKAYIFHYATDADIFVGSSNMSRGALTDSIEWNYRLRKSDNEQDFEGFYETFSELFYNHSEKITDQVLADYSKQWTQPKFIRKIVEDEEKTVVTPLFEPRGGQIEALYALDASRKEGNDKGIVVAATGIGKTYLAAFDAKEFGRTLFVAHREEIIKQAAVSFKNVSPEKTQGFFYNSTKDNKQDVIFTLVQTLGKASYLNENYFKPDAFDYIVIDEFHHATAEGYKRILNYFKPKFLLGLTATPERLDNGDVFALCDYNQVYEVRLKEAINKGWLVPFRYYGIYDDTVDYDKLTIRQGKYDEKELEKSLMIHQRANLVLKHYLKYNSQHAMAFCTSRDHAEYMASYFNDNNIPAAAVYSGAQGANAMERNKALNQLAKGKIRIVFSVDMFNEGVDVPNIDMVLFLRPTESPTIFLQQLGRGLRKAKNKEYLNVLDFIGNYKKAQLIPFLLAGQTYNHGIIKQGKVLQIEYPEECMIDFDFRLIDLFQKQASAELTIKEKIIEAYKEIKENIGHRPLRQELFVKLPEEILQVMRSNSKLNIFNDYLNFLYLQGELTDQEKVIYHSHAKEFLNLIETTGMSKSYKIPVLEAFILHGDMQLAVTEDEICQSFRRFYAHGSNGMDLLKDKKTANYKEWQDKDYLKEAKNNPIKFLLKTSGDFFIPKEGYAIAIKEELEQYIHLPCFKEHFEDIISYRTLSYYKKRFTDKNKK